MQRSSAFWFLLFLGVLTLLPSCRQARYTAKAQCIQYSQANYPISVDTARSMGTVCKAEPILTDLPNTLLHDRPHRHILREPKAALSHANKKQVRLPYPFSEPEPEEYQPGDVVDCALLGPTFVMLLLFVFSILLGTYFASLGIASALFLVLGYALGSLVGAQHRDAEFDKARERKVRKWLRAIAQLILLLALAFIGLFLGIILLMILMEADLYSVAVIGALALSPLLLSFSLSVYAALWARKIRYRPYMDDKHD